MKKMEGTRTIATRVSHDEYDILKAASKLWGISLSETIRKMASPIGAEVYRSLRELIGRQMRWGVSQSEYDKLRADIQYAYLTGIISKEDLDGFNSDMEQVVIKSPYDIHVNYDPLDGPMIPPVHLREWD